MAGERRWKEFERYPKYKEAYIRAFDKMLIERERRGLKNRDLWKTGIKVFKWWMEDKKYRRSTCIWGRYGDLRSVHRLYKFQIARNLT